MFEKTPEPQQVKWTNIETESKWRKRAKTCGRQLHIYIAFIVCFFLLARAIIECVDKYLSGNTATADKYQHITTAPFPDLSICPSYPYKLEVLKRNGIPDKSTYQFKAGWVSNIKTKTPVELFNEVIYTAEDLVKDINLYMEQPMDGSSVKKMNIAKTKGKLCGEDIFFPTEYYYNGRCWTLRLPKCALDKGVLEIVADFQTKTDVFIHHKGQFFSPESRNRVDVDKGYFIKIAINPEIIQLLNSTGRCTDVFGPSESDTYDVCINTELAKLMNDKVGCTVPWLMDKTNICIKEEDRKAAFGIYQDNRRNQQSICKNPCSFSNMYFGPPVVGQSEPELADRARMVFYFRRSVKVTREFVLYTVLSLVAEVGGYVGLLLGFSVFNIASIFTPVVTKIFGDTSSSIQPISE